MKGAGNTQEQTPIYKKIQNYIFRFSDLLGQGNFSKVYSGTNELTNDVVAIKIVELESLKSKKLEELLFSEIDVLKKLNHPNVLRCFDVFTSNRNCYIITELCNEGDLESKLRKHRFFPEPKAHPYIIDIFQGLLYLSDNQIIHRDIKVANIFIHNGRAKIADFGFAKFTRDKFKDMSIGSPLYMSPEGFVNNIYGPKTDVWAFGVLIYELLHGYTPYSNCKTETELRQSLSIPIGRGQIRADVSNDLREVILACMEVDQAKRISVPELKNFPFFRKQSTQFLQINLKGLQGSEDRLRSPSYNGQDKGVRTFTNGYREGGEEPNFLTQQGRKERETQKPVVSVFVPQPHTSKNIMELPADKSKERRAISSQRNIPAEDSRPSKDKHPPEKGLPRTLRILSGVLSFKECVNILHYARLVFKYLLTLRVSNYSSNNQLFKLTRWLMEVLAEMKQKMERKEVLYEGENAGLREKKLREVREQYEKKYSSELESYIQVEEHFGQAALALDYMSSFCFSLFQKYDSLITREHNTTLLMLGHCILLIYSTTRMLRECFDSSNYSVFATYKDVEGFLALKKEQVTISSYQTYKKKLILY